MSNQRFIILFFLAAAVVAGFTIRSFAAELLPVFSVPDFLLLGILSLSALLAMLSGVVAFILLLRNQKAVTFVDEVVTELRKVFWPGREETFNNTTVVIATVVILSSTLAIYDFFWAKVTSILLYS
jgi:preprotein translocase SecE subunit